jgi:hypothetical protein
MDEEEVGFGEDEPGLVNSRFATLSAISLFSQLRALDFVGPLRAVAFSEAPNTIEFFVRTEALF